MTTAQANILFKSDTATNTRGWIDGVKNLILAAGLLQTSDTGQLDTQNIINAPGSNATMGFHVFRFPDTLQSSRPIIVKLTYLTNSSGLSRIYVTVGAQTDGAGGISSPIATGDTGSGGTADAYASYACYIDGTFAMCLGYGSASGGLYNNCISFLVIDRARDTSGNAVSNGFLVEYGTAQNSLSGSRSYYGAASPAGTNNFIPALIPSTTAASTSEGANVNVFRHYSMTPGVRPHVGMLTYMYADLGALTPFTATVLGSSHTYLPMGYAMNYWSAVPAGSHCCAIRWE